MIRHIDPPNSDKEYSTLGWTSAYTVRIIIPSVSKELKLSVNTSFLRYSFLSC